MDWHQQITGADILLVILAVVFPPASVLCSEGFGVNLFINVGLTLLGCFPGMIHALYLAFKDDEPPAVVTFFAREAQEQNSDSSSASLSNGLIARLVMEQLDTDNLLSLSLVNKVWCTSARSILRSRKCLARIPYGSHGCVCSDLLTFNAILKGSHDLPYTGLSLRVPGFCSKMISWECPREDEDDTPVAEDQLVYYNLPQASDSPPLPLCYKEILEKLVFRNLKFQWDFLSPCPSQWLLREVLKLKRGELVELKAGKIPLAGSLRTHLRIPEEDWLPNLKFLDLRTCESRPRAKLSLIKGAPKLQTLVGYTVWPGPFGLLDYPRIASVSHRFKFLYGEESFSEDMDRAIRAYVNSKPRMRKLEVCGPLKDEDLEIPYTYMKFVMGPLLLLTSGSLSSISLGHHHLLLAIPQVPFQPCPRLKVMTLLFYKSIDKAVRFPTLQTFDWMGWFPGLKRVKIQNIEEQDDRPVLEDWMLEKIKARSSLSFQALSVQEIQVHGNWINFSTEILTSWKNLFPNVVKADIGLWMVPVQDLVRLVLLFWPGLESLKLRFLGKHLGDMPNLDAMLCGISQEEVDEFLRKPASDLDSKDLQPVGPSILDFRHLRELQLILTGHGLGEEGAYIPPTCLFCTRVTTQLAFAQMSGLKFSISTEVCRQAPGNCAYSFSHLKPYVEVSTVVKRVNVRC